MARRTVDCDLIISSYEQGLGVPEISQQYGISEKRIYYVLKQYGVALRPRSGVGKILNSAQEDEIVALYQAGMDAVQLATRYGITSTTVYKTLERYGVTRRANSDIKRKLNLTQEAEAMALYQQGLPASQIAGQYGVNDQTVYNILEAHGLNRRSRSEARILYPRNEHAFDEITTEHAAYWLGFIAADGNVTRTTLRIGLSAKDADHLRKLAEWLAPTIPIYAGINNHDRPVATLAIGSKYLVEALAKYSIVPRKTYIMKHLPPVPEHLMRHMLRGYIDADGYFSRIEDYGARFGVAAFNREMVEEIQDWFIQELGVSRTSPVHTGTAWHYRKTGTLQVGKIAAYLYSDAQVYLDRKYERAHRSSKEVCN